MVDRHTGGIDEPIAGAGEGFDPRALEALEAELASRQRASRNDIVVEQWDIGSGWMTQTRRRRSGDVHNLLAGASIFVAILGVAALLAFGYARRPASEVQMAETQTAEAPAAEALAAPTQIQPRAMVLRAPVLIETPPFEPPLAAPAIPPSAPAAEAVQPSRSGEQVANQTRSSAPPPRADSPSRSSAVAKTLAKADEPSKGGAIAKTEASPKGSFAKDDPGPNFDCRPPFSFAEDKVCANDDLNHQNRELAEAFQSALAAGVPITELNREQSRWAKVRTEAAYTTPWRLSELYAARIDQLARQASIGGHQPLRDLELERELGREGSGASINR